VGDQTTLQQTQDLTTGRLAGTFLEDDITHMTISPSGEQFFYIMPFGTSVIGIIENFIDNKKNQIFDSPFTEWLPQWPEENTLALTTKASGTTGGFLYFLKTETEEFEKILGDVSGLTTNVNTDATAIFYSESIDGGFSSHLLDINNYDRKKINVSTLPEKCVWSAKNTRIIYCGVPGTVPNNVYPDVWYQGIVSFSDTLWKINVDTNILELLVVPAAVIGQEIDVINPFLGPNEKYLFFTNKKDSTLWSLKLSNN